MQRNIKNKINIAILTQTKKKRRETKYHIDEFNINSENNKMLEKQCNISHLSDKI